MIHPLYAWLTRRKRPRAAARTAYVGLWFGAAALAFGVWAWWNGQVLALRGMLVVGGLGMVMLPAGVASLAAALTVQELRGEQFQFLRLTNLPTKLMAQGIFFAAQYRTRSLRALAMGFLPLLVIGGVAEAVQLMAGIYYNGMTYMVMRQPGAWEVGLPMSFLVLVAAFLWSMNLVAARVGAAIAIRWRSLILAPLLAPLSMLLITAAPLLVALNVALWPFFCLGGAYLLVWMGRYLLGQGLQRDAAIWLRQVDVT